MITPIQTRRLDQLPGESISALRQRAAFEAEETGCRIECIASGEDVWPMDCDNRGALLFSDLAGTQVYATGECVGVVSPVE